MIVLSWTFKYPSHQQCSLSRHSTSCLVHSCSSIAAVELVIISRTLEQVVMQVFLSCILNSNSILPLSTFRQSNNLSEESAPTTKFHSYSSSSSDLFLAAGGCGSFHQFSDIRLIFGCTSQFRTDVSDVHPKLFLILMACHTCDQRRSVGLAQARPNNTRKNKKFNFRAWN